MELPKQVDVVVIGGGFVGTSTALVLAERGVRVALCEKGVIAGEASGRSMGYVDSQYADPEKLELIARSKAIWQSLNDRTGQDTGYRLTGLLAGLTTSEDRAGAEEWLTIVRGLEGAEGRMVTRQEIQRLFPGMEAPPEAGLFSPNDASVEPQWAAPAIATGAQRKGAKILQGCAVRGIETSGGAISGVITERGPIACKAVVLAGGAWSPMFAGSLGLSLVQFEIAMTMMSLTPVPGPTVSMSNPAYGIRRQVDGGYSFGVVDFAAPIVPKTFAHARELLPAIEFFWPLSHPGFSPSEFWRQLTMPTRWALDSPSPFEARRIMVPELCVGPTAHGLAQLRKDYTLFKAAQVREIWSGLISTTADNMPIISAIPEYPGLFVGSGFSYGLTMGPAAGEALADLAMGRTPSINLHPFRLDRFSDGSKLAFRT
ncbi:NAD(P)/FAD-dependent oxidoreductase [Paraburkholderia acidiphila]|uniref:FAD-dependent oxidoreductase n=1 Tax=Paraburkholderia acidiphila TaxID=2571747 RepID=A0A7Z2G8A0_9BURK|nr:FAD-binding oxidoreductase [Paraburkholderia acidiphila]QGZ56897.1 FAD-dependent oxidoreductase [Paraburkholderia acidiphila]